MARAVSRVVWWPLVVPVVGAALAAVAINRTVIHPDEVGFLLNARRIAGVGPSSALPYYPGYSLLLSPLAWLTSDVGVLHRLMQGVNLVLLVVTARLGVQFLRSTSPNMSPLAVSSAVAVALLYPPYSVYATFALSENLLILLSVALPLACRRWMTPGRTGLSTTRLTVVGLVAGLTLSVHPRAVALVLAGIAAAASMRATIGTRRLLMFVLGVGVGVIAARLWVGWVLDAPQGMFSVGESNKTSVVGLVESNLNPRAFVVLPFTALGQLLYAGVASLALAPIGLVALWSLREQPSLRPLVVHVATTLAVTLAVSALFMNQGTGDKAIYGRYLDAALLPLLLLGAASVVEGVTRSTARFVSLIPPVIAAVLLAVRGADAFVGREQLLNISGLAVVLEVAGEIDLRAVAIMGIAGALVVTALAGRFWPVALASLGVAYTAVGAVAVFEFHRAADRLDRQVQLPDFVRDELIPASPGGLPCIALQDSADPTASWFQQNLRLEMLDADFQPWPDNEPSPCRTLAISGSTVVPGARAIGSEPSANLFLWIWDGPLSDRLAARGIVGTPSPGEAVPADLPLSIEIVSAAYNDDSGMVDVEVSITNGWDRPLFPSGSFPGGVGGMAVGVEWRDPERPEREGEPFRLFLSGVLRPGASQVLIGEVPTSIAVPGDLVPFGPGVYQLHVEAVQEGIYWLGETHGDSVTMDLGFLDPPETSADTVDAPEGESGE